RSAHEEFASLPVRRAAPQSMFPKQQPEAPPTLAMLRFEPPEITPSAPVAEATRGAPQESLPTSVTPVEAQATAEPDKQAALGAAGAPEGTPAEVAKPEPTKLETPTTVALAPVAAAPPAPAPEIAASAPAAILSVETPAVDQPATTLTDADTKLASTKIATLGGPPVTIEQPVATKPVVARAVAPVKKKAKPAPAKKHRVAARATSTAAAPAQTDPFGQPFPR
ncbi:MAG: hypothetical protein JWR89_5041, partial [Tardiphaga sp.]|uniref:hypothetical protein n=1 Tax=Tardiphaga sp. TaxID=1926292 RepID=UPI00260B0F33